MTNDILTIGNPSPSSQPLTRRLIADAIKSQGETILLTGEGVALRKMTHAEFLAQMVWDGLVNGELMFSDGTPMKITETPKLWMELLKFASGHIDGGVDRNTNIGQVNVFKVYQNIDVDRM